MIDDHNVVRFRPVEDEIAELNRSFAIVLFGSKVAVMRQGQDADGKPIETFLGTDDFKNLLGNRFKFFDNNRVKPLAAYWLSHPHRRQFDGVVFRPGHDVAGYYNFWSGWAVAPHAGGLLEVLGPPQGQRVRR